MSSGSVVRSDGDTLRFIDRPALDRLLAMLASVYDVYLPRPRDGAPTLRRLDPDGAPPSFEWNGARTATPLKALWFSPRHVVARWTGGVPDDACVRRERAIVGAKACDLRALAILDRVFLDFRYREPAYAAARAADLVISGDCTDPEESCFCTILGDAPYPTSHFDLNLSPVAAGYLVEIGSRKGRWVVEAYPDLFSEPGESLAEERARMRGEVEARVRRQNERFPTRDPLSRSIEKNLRTAIWAELAATCVECSACNYVCPTCHCFLLLETGSVDDACRACVWDSCIHAGHARIAGGGTPRLQLTERFKNHFLHKFVVFPETWGVTACTGCGRCIDACMGGIDKRACLHGLETRWIPSEVHEVT